MNRNKITRRATLLSKPWAIALLCCLGLGTAGSVSAQEVILDRPADRPVEELFLGQTAYTQPEGSLQMIVSASQARTGDMRNSSIMGRAEYGVSDRLQLQASIPLDITDRSSGFAAQTGVNRIEAGAMYRLTDRRARVSLSAGMDVEVPFGEGDVSRDVTGDRPDAGPTFKPSLMAASGSGRVTVHANAQAELGQPSRALNYSIGSMYNLGSWVPTLELNARSEENTRSEFYATPGVYYKISDQIQLGVGAAVGLNDQSEDVQVVGKLSVQIP